MMNRLKLKVFVFLFVLQASTYLNASVVQNGDFENGLANWSVSRNSDFQGDPILVVTQFQNYSPTKGSSFALLRSSLENTYNRLFQAVNLKAGDRLAGSAFFKTQDYLPFDDDAYIRIVELDAVLFFESSQCRRRLWRNALDKLRVYDSHHWDFHNRTCR